MRQISFAKGHGTENDFVIIPDPCGGLELSSEDVSAICHRRAGIGGDGILRVVRARHVPGYEAEPPGWFMDYRNADGSVAPMCGNGVRVFTRYLLDRGWATGPTVDIATRDGVKQISASADGRFQVCMGPVTLDEAAVAIRPYGSDSWLSGTPAEVGNSHAVVFVEDLTRLALDPAPDRSPTGRFRDGANIEFVQWVAPRHITMRVHERGSGETRSCGTGACAGAAVAAHQAGDEARPVSYRVDVPGGVLDVELNGAEANLTGPAEIVASGTFVLTNPASSSGPAHLANPGS